MADLVWDYDFGEVDTGLIDMQPESVCITIEEDSEGEMNTSWSRGSNDACIFDRWKLAAEESSPCSTLSERGAPICRQFWKAGIYNDSLASVSKSYVGSSYLQIHPKFLHSNATSHKWAFGAIAELLDNAVDEIQNGATYVIIDKTSNPRNGSPALLIQDDGAGMDPEAMRKCLSFGFSDKKSESSIGKYGNGFKTSSMRLGADAIVFSRTVVDQTLMQSIGLLSYTFLTRSGYDQIVVPMVHYKFNPLTGFFESLQPKGDTHSNLNLSVLLQWSPYSTEEELLKQFDNVGSNGTKIIVYNLWLNDDGNTELDFKSDPEDICLASDAETKGKDGTKKAISGNHIANRLQYSLRAYLSILYVQLPPNFCIVLRGKVVLYHNIATDLKYPQFIRSSNGKGRGVVGKFGVFLVKIKVLIFSEVVMGLTLSPAMQGVLEADFIQPTHSKQDFEKTNVFQKLVTRLKQMTTEYWDLHCRSLGYTIPKKALPSHASDSCSKKGLNLKRKSIDQTECFWSENVKVKMSGENMPDNEQDQKKTLRITQENKKLKERCLELEENEKELNLKVINLKSVLQEAQQQCNVLLTELQLLERATKIENVNA
ncbi:hypothetical protein SSX86_007857 [Deinandra increscens subsp. villosa]|uniref:Morc S5 domain-containing protein n=1 Tax=Deinandra increscens subsp. villosa TaxID=3103831 RepID=A0AAP0DIA5_9ASTR